MMLGDKINYYEKEKKFLRTTPAQYKDEFEWLKQMDAYALCNEQINLQTAFNNFFKSPKAGFPKFKSKKRDKSSYTTSNVNGVIKILDDKHIKLPKIKSLRIKLHRQIPENSRIKSATIERKPSGKYYISLCIEYESQILDTKLDKNKSVGLDYSSHDFYVDSEGNRANYPKFYRNNQKKLAIAQRRLSRKKLGSNNYNKQKIKVTGVHKKIANSRNDFLHKTSANLANSYDYICVEDINLRSISKCLKLGKSTLDNGFGIFRNYLQ
jgi:putative transposase